MFHHHLPCLPTGLPVYVDYYYWLKLLKQTDLETLLLLFHLQPYSSTLMQTVRGWLLYGMKRIFRAMIGGLISRSSAM